MPKFLVLSAAEVAKALTMTDAIEAVADAYRQKATGSGLAWPMVYEQFMAGESDMDIRSGRLADSGLFGLKLTAWFSHNPETGLPEIYGTTLLCDDRTGAPLALVNASAVTGLRTGAAGALGIRTLARPDSSTLMVAGCGHQSAFQVAAALVACPNIDRVLMWDPVSDEAPVARVAAVTETVEKIFADCGVRRTYRLEAVADGAAAAAQADAIVTITPATSPIIPSEWVRPGTHVSCVGADMPGKQELASGLVARARVYVDDRAQSVASGELEVPVSQGAITPEHIVAELGEVLAGTAEGRASDDQVTVFDTSGIAVQDLAATKVAYDRAVEMGLGTYVEL